MGLGSIIGTEREGGFDDYGEFVPEHLPEPGDGLAGTDVLTGPEHAAAHALARDVFEERGVYDVTFGYNLARLNLDRRHPDAGFRYGVAPDDQGTLRAEFTPTTEFCPQSDTLTVGAFRAFNGESDRHDYDLVSVRVDECHHESVAINGKLRQLEASFIETGAVVDVGTGGCGEEVPTERGYGATDAPF